MSESVLNKGFKEKDVNRMRNLLTLKYGEKTVSQVGFQRKISDHVEGDIWEENGKIWTIKDGLKQSITKMHKVKDILKVPLLCPHCNNAMKHPYDKKFYSLHKMCFDCVIKMETRLRIEGKYEEYALKIQTQNAISFINDARVFINEYANSSKDSYYSEEGEKQVFVGGSSEKNVIDAWCKELDDIKNELKSKLTQNEIDENSGRSTNRS